MGLYSAIAAELQSAGITGDELVMALERIEAKADIRSAAAKRQAVYRKRVKKSVTSDELVADGVSPSFPSSSPTPPITTLPSPSPDELKGAHAEGKQKHGIRLPDDWAPSETLVAWAKSDQGMDDDQITEQTEQFCDHFHAKPGAAGRKLNWDMAWKNWIRNAWGYRKTGPPKDDYGPSSKPNGTKPKMTKNEALKILAS